MRRHFVHGLRERDFFKCCQDTDIKRHVVIELDQASFGIKRLGNVEINDVFWCALFSLIGLIFHRYDLYNCKPTKFNLIYQLLSSP